MNNEIKMPSIPFPMYWDNMPLDYSIAHNEIEIISGARTDMFRDPNVKYNTDNAPKLLFVPDNDFVISASIEHSFTNKWDGGAIVLISDSSNWIKYCFEKDYTGARRVVSVVTKDISDDCNSVEIEVNRVFFKLAKADDVITLYYSKKGNEWFLVRHFQFDTSSGFTIGLMAQSPVGEKCTVRFADITYQKKKINDPYTGE